MAKGKAVAPVGDKGPKPTVMVSQKLREWISSKSQKGETVDGTLRRLLNIPEKVPNQTPRDPDTFKISDDATSIRLNPDLKGWIESRSQYNESIEAVLRRLLGVGQKEGRDGRR